MLKKLLDLRVILIVLLILSWGAAFGLFYLTKQNTDSDLASKDAEIASLQEDLAAIGELVPAYTIVEDVPSGKCLEETDLELIEVPLSMSTNLIQDSEELIGKYCKIPMTSGTVFTIDSVYEEPINSDMRYYDVIVDTMPIGLQVGSFVDIRIKYGTGSDYLGIVHRQVAEINGNTLKLILTEEDILTYSSMLIENIIYNEKFQVNQDVNGDGKINESDTVDAIGAYIYAVEYIVGGIQNETSQSYAPSALIQALLAGDPNINEAKLTPEERVLRRHIIESSIGINDSSVNSTASKIQQYVSEIIKEGQKEYERRKEAEAEAMEDEY